MKRFGRCVQTAERPNRGGRGGLTFSYFGCYHSERLESQNLCDRGICVQVLLGLDDPAVVLSAVINGSGWKFGLSGQQMSTLHCLITAITSVIS